MKGYNLMHLDAMYDLLRNIYVDVSLQIVDMSHATTWHMFKRKAGSILFVPKILMKLYQG